MKGYRLLLTVSAFGISDAALAQAAITAAGDEQPSAASPQRGDTGSLMEDIVVTAQKRSAGEKAQNIPIAITALGAAQLANLNVRNLGDLNSIAPNVTLDENGTIRGYANFTIRGSSQNSSVPTLEPGVGLFVDGVYQGVSAGAVGDNFDLGSVQILRGPQGTLFGRNVTGGAVLVETARPSGDFGGYVEGSLETGPEYSAKGAVDVPLAPGLLNARLAGYYAKDHGWFRNDFNGSKFGKNRTYIIRPTFALTAGALKETVVFEYGKVDGDGPALQPFNPNNPFNPSRKKFGININDEGLIDRRWYSATSESVLDVGFGDGSITNVFGYRKFDETSRADLDASPLSLFTINTAIHQYQLSNELRYAGRFGALEVTTGLFYFHQDIVYREARVPFISGARGGGGHQKQNGYGIFGQASYHLTDSLTLVGGLRYSYEEKAGKVVILTPGRCLDVRQVCDFSNAPSVNKKLDFNSLSPKLSVDYKINPDVLLYASFSKATRSGGFNVRLSSPLDPGTYGQENVTSYEIGTKADLLGKALRVNVSAFINDYKDLQRTVSTFIGTNIIQTIENSADARIQGVELDITAQPVKGLQFVVGLGYLDGKYTSVRGDLNGDGVINQTDKKLILSRIPKYSTSAGAIYDLEFGSGASLRSQVFFSHRSRQAGQDSNVVFYPAYDDLRADITFTLPGKATSVSVYGRNLTNVARNTGSAGIVGALPSGGYKDVSEGRSIGVEVKQKF